MRDRFLSLIFFLVALFTLTFQPVRAQGTAAVAPMHFHHVHLSGANASAATANPTPACGEQRPGAAGPTGIFHDDTTESYVVISGSATLITGGVVNGRRSAPDAEVTTILNGPSCSGTMVGFTSREIKTGDIIIIPERVPHGFSAIPDHVTYLSIRPDLKKVLQHGYVNPALRK